MIPPHNVRAHNKQHAMSRPVALSPPPLVRLSLLLSFLPFPSYANALIFYLISYAEGVGYMYVDMVLRRCVKHEYGGKGNKKCGLDGKGDVRVREGGGGEALHYFTFIISSSLICKRVSKHIQTYANKLTQPHTTKNQMSKLRKNRRGEKRARLPRDRKKEAKKTIVEVGT